MEVLFHELRLDYQVPIISQQGEVCGKLHVEIYRIPLDEPSNDDCENLNSRSTNSLESDFGDYRDNDATRRGDVSQTGFYGDSIRCRVILFV